MTLVIRTAKLTAGLGAVLCGCGWAIAGGVAAAGALIGSGLALLSVLSFGFLGYILALGGSIGRTLVFWATIVWLLKLPILWIAVSYVSGLGGVATAWFLAGLGLVYCLLVIAARFESDSAREGHFS